MGHKSVSHFPELRNTLEDKLSSDNVAGRVWALIRRATCNMCCLCYEGICKRQRGQPTLKWTRWRRSKATPLTLGVSQLVWLQTICGPVYPKVWVVMWNVCVDMRLWVCTHVDIVFHLDCKALKALVPNVTQVFEMGTKIPNSSLQ